MVNKIQRKGAVEMSLNLIIMLIIGMVVLGLVISFVSGLVNQGKDQFTAQLSKNDEAELRAIESCPDNFCVSPSPSLKVKKGGTSTVFIKVRAFSDADIVCSAGPLGGNSCSSINFESVDIEGTSLTSDFTISGPGLNADQGLDTAKAYTLTAPKDIAIGTYYVTFTLTTGNSDPQEVTQTLTVNVE